MQCIKDMLLRIEAKKRGLALIQIGGDLDQVRAGEGQLILQRDQGEDRCAGRR